MQPRVSVIILNYNGIQFLQDCIESVMAQTYPNVEVVVVDNGSTDGSQDFVRTRFPSVLLVQNSSNLGFAEGNNRGAAAASGDALFFLNNDTRMSPDALEWAVRTLTTGGSVGIVAPKLLLAGSPDKLNSAGGRCDIFGYAEDRGIFERDVGQYDRTGEVFYACGAALLVWASLYRNAGGFDPSYFIYYEDVDLCWRLRLQGCVVAFSPRAVVYHKYGATVPRTTLRRLRLVERNRLASMLSNFGFPALCFSLASYGCMRLGQIAILLATGQRAAVATLLVAYTELVSGLGAVVARRRKVQSTRTTSDRMILRHMEFRSIELEVLRTRGVRFEL